MFPKDEADPAQGAWARFPCGRGLEPPPPGLPAPSTAAKCPAHPAAANNANNATLLPKPGCALAPRQALLKVQGLQH